MAIPRSELQRLLKNLGIGFYPPNATPLTTNELTSLARSPLEISLIQSYQRPQSCYQIVTGRQSKRAPLLKSFQSRGLN